MQETPLSDIRIGQITHQWARAQKIPSHHFSTIDSTNARARTEAFLETSYEEQLILYVAETQSAGKGRGRNTWAGTAPGAQLLSTWSFMLEAPPHPTVSPLIGLALFRAAAGTWPFLDWSLKAPNDLYVGDKKVAGLLLETLSQGADHRLLIGLGLNVLAAPESVATAASLVHSLPPAAPLLAEDWISFLERLVFEFSFALQLSGEPLNSTSTHALLAALNRHPHLKEKYLALDAHGNLTTPSGKISWQEL